MSYGIGKVTVAISNEVSESMTMDFELDIKILCNVYAQVPEANSHPHHIVCVELMQTVQCSVEVGLIRVWLNFSYSLLYVHMYVLLANLIKFSRVNNYATVSCTARNDTIFV
jgi:phosphopantetheine adenylyltransferase